MPADLSGAAVQTERVRADKGWSAEADGAISRLAQKYRERQGIVVKLWRCISPGLCELLWELRLKSSPHREELTSSLSRSYNRRVASRSPVSTFDANHSTTRLVSQFVLGTPPISR
eukprot:4495289-Amphidinium_carterae.2